MIVNDASGKDGYYTTSEASDEAAPTTSEAATPNIKLWFCFDKGLIIGPEQREKLIREEQKQAAVAKEEIPTPSVVLLVKEVDQAKATSTHHHAGSTSTSSSSSSSNYSSTFQSKLGAMKRKMHDSYQQLANTKKQRRIQVIDPRDLPPQPSLKGKGNIAIAVAARKKMISQQIRRLTTTSSMEDDPHTLVRYNENRPWRD